MSIFYYDSPRSNALAKRIEEQHQEEIRRQIPSAHEAANQINEQFDQENAEQRQSAFVAAIDERLRGGVPVALIDAVALFADVQGANVAELSASEREQASEALVPLVQHRAEHVRRELATERRRRERRIEARKRERARHRQQQAARSEQQRLEERIRNQFQSLRD